MLILFLPFMYFLDSYENLQEELKMSGRWMSQTTSSLGNTFSSDRDLNKNLIETHKFYSYCFQDFTNSLQSWSSSTHPFFLHIFFIVLSLDISLSFYGCIGKCKFEEDKWKREHVKSNLESQSSWRFRYESNNEIIRYTI